MIECSSKNIWYKKRQHTKFKRFLTFFIILFVVTVIILYYNFFVTRKIYKICEDYTYSYSTECVNSVILESLSISTKYADLVCVEKNSDGDITLITTNSHKVNLISREVSINTEKNLKQKLTKGIPIPLFTFLGIEILSGYGPSIWYKPIEVVSVLCEFDSVFQSVGINQTLHSIYIVVNSKINIDSIFSAKIKECKTKVLISETILVGKVPDIYLNGKYLDGN